MKKEKFITGIDIGASNVRCIIGEQTQPNMFNILGCASAYHNCIKKGVTVDLKALSDVISRVVYEAEEESDRKVSAAYINIAGPHVEGIPSRGENTISDRDNEITRHDAKKVNEIARSLNMPYEREIIHTIHHGYTIDGEKNIIDPAGMFGVKLEADLYLITAKAAFVENIKKAVRQTGVGVAGVVISSIPTSMALLSTHEKQIGTVLIDIGKDLTEISIYTEGILRYAKSMAIGGDYITKEIASRFRLPYLDAERLKIENANLDEDFSEDDKIILKVDSQKRTISKRQLQEALITVYKKIFTDIKAMADKNQIFRDAANGIVLTGAASVAEGVAEKAEIEFGAPVRVGHIKELGSCPRPLPSHVFATAVGLIKYGFKDLAGKRGFLEKGAKSTLNTLFNYARNLYREYF